MNQVSYALGMSIGHQLQQMNATELNIEDFAKGIKDVFGGKTEMTEAEVPDRERKKGESGNPAVGIAVSGTARGQRSQA